jgi:hypothetical protein
MHYSTTAGKVEGKTSQNHKLKQKITHMPGAIPSFRAIGRGIFGDRPHNLQKMRNTTIAETKSTQEKRN